MKFALPFLFINNRNSIAMSRKISPFRYTAENNVKGTIALLKEYNVPPKAYDDVRKATNALKKLSVLHRTDSLFLQKMLEIHPDSKLFKASNMASEVKSFDAEEYNSIDALDTHYSYIDDAINSKLGSQNSHITMKNALIGVGIGVGFTIALVGLVKMLQK